MGDGSQVCQLVGEPYKNVLYTDCLECVCSACPVSMLFRIMRRIAPETIKELEKEMKP